MDKVTQFFAINTLQTIKISGWRRIDPNYWQPRDYLLPLQANNLEL